MVPVFLLPFLLPFLLLFSGSGQAPIVSSRPDLDRLVEATGFGGTILLYEPGSMMVYAGGAGTAHKGFLPASTFKVYNSLIGLETGVIDTTHLFKWDRQPQRLKAWEQDLRLREAFQASCVPCFRELARMIGEKRMRQGLRKLRYGNQDMAAGLDLFWLEGGMQITPMQQLMLVSRLSRLELPFSKESQRLVHGLMFLGETDGRRLYGKTGWAQEGSHDTGWFIGWESQGSRVKAFVSLLDAENPGDGFGAARRKLAEDALRWPGGKE